jgi:zinc and cadmium transporter
MAEFMWITGACLVSGVVSAAAAGLFLFLSDARQKMLLPFMVSFATGALLGAAFMGLLPETLEHLPVERAVFTLLGGILAFFALEQWTVWRHCHRHNCEVHDASGTMILVGDSVHNFVDGAVIAAAFMTSIPLGVATALAVLAHEIPQEAGDFAILLRSGWPKKRALLFNVLSSLTALPGAYLAVALYRMIDNLLPYVTGLAAAGFFYIALADLIPGNRGRVSAARAVGQFALIVLGIVVVALMESGHGHP